MRQKYRTYTERPPSSARMARAAWDYLTHRYAAGRRTIGELFYSPNCDGGRAWVCVMNSLEEDTLNWGAGKNELIRDVHVSTVEAWADGRIGPDSVSKFGTRSKIVKSSPSEREAPETDEDQTPDGPKMM